MSLILCRQEQVEHPYLIEDLGIHIYSSQELCYVIYNHPFLVMEDFVDLRLTNFLRCELRMPFLAERLEKWMANRGESDELLFLILQDCGYYSAQEQALYRQRLTTLRRLPEEEYEKRRADYFYSLNLFGRSLSIYEKILENESGKRLTGEFKGKIWNNIAACCTKLFCYQRAMNAYDRAFCESRDEVCVKRMYFLTVMNPELSMKEAYAAMITDEDKAAWDIEAQAVIDEARNGSAAVRVLQQFEKDPLKKMAGASEMLNSWKVAYRKML